jgi:hypothetical protein
MEILLFIGCLISGCIYGGTKDAPNVFGLKPFYWSNISFIIAALQVLYIRGWIR